MGIQDMLGLLNTLDKQGMSPELLWYTLDKWNIWDRLGMLNSQDMEDRLSE